MENSLNTRNDAMLLEYIEHAFKNLNNALICLQPNENDVMGDIDGAFSCINNSIIDIYWNNYLNNSTTLTAQEIFAVKKWFNKIRHVIEFVNRQSFNPQELKEGIPPILNDQALRAVKEKLTNAVNQKRS